MPGEELYTQKQSKKRFKLIKIITVRKPWILKDKLVDYSYSQKL